MIENSFKHGIHDINHNWIRIDLSVKNDWLSVKIENSYEAGNCRPARPKGIGLENVRKRLEILYPKQHEFKYRPEGDAYLTILKIKNLKHENTLPDR